MNIEEKAPTISADTIRSAGQSIVADADARAAGAVSMLTLVQQARLSAQIRAVNAAVSAYGKNSSQADAARHAVAATRSVHARLSLLRAKVSTPTPSVPAEGWALHGHVYDANAKPQQRYTVFLVDAQKNYIDQYGFSYTDANGYFVITSPGGAAANTAQAATAQPLPPGEEGEHQPEDMQLDGSSSTSQSFIEVADPNGNPVRLSQSAFTPVRGQAIYQTITLPSGHETLGDPPAQIREVALPPAARKRPPKKK